jgi:hypothetical protein
MLRHVTEGSLIKTGDAAEDLVGGFGLCQQSSFCLRRMGPVHADAKSAKACHCCSVEGTQ